MRLRSAEMSQIAVIAVVAAVLLFMGWRLFWFLTDDAFIAFRYVSNSMLGHGYVWNPPPFKPVEGYTSFLWVVLLDGVWRMFHVEPPQASNFLSLGFSYLTLLLTILMVLKLQWRDRLGPYRVLFLILVLWGILTNRTFLAWSSSGLETAMFNFLVTLWVYSAVFIPLTSNWALFSLAASAGLVCLTRPDGLLFYMATLLMILVSFAQRKTWPGVRQIGALSPLLIPLLHLAWRIHTYGEWLPNTYYAKKIMAWWPESGIRYAASFILEYALWVWIGLAFIVLIHRLNSFTKDNRTGVKIETVIEISRNAISRYMQSGALLRIIAVGALIGHVSYYTFVIGGDHFEYRVYSHLVPLIFVSFLWLLNALQWKPILSVCLLAAFIVLSYPIPWTHWVHTRGLTTRKETFRLEKPVAPHFQRVFAWYAQAFDAMQFWLIDRSVCMRHQEHKIFREYQASRYPPRGVGQKVASNDYPIYICDCVGVASWVLPRVNIIDILGLNDYVIARNPVDLTRNIDDANPHGYRQMAHDRRPPKGYVRSFSPNVYIHFKQHKVQIQKRARQLTADDIIENENRWIKWLKHRKRDGDQARMGS